MPHWRQFFAGLDDNAARRCSRSTGPSWQRKDWPRPESGDLVSALDGNWPVAPPPAAKAGKGATPEAKAPSLSAEDVRKATMDSVRALMMIRAYRMRGHLAADLDPLRLEEPDSHPELDPATYGFTDADMDRPIFLDKVLGLEHADRPPDHRHPEAHLLRHARRRVHAHLGPRAEGLDPGAHRGCRQVDQLHRRTARRPSSTS